MNKVARWFEASLISSIFIGTVVSIIFFTNGCSSANKRLEAGGAYNRITGTNADGTLITQPDPTFFTLDTTANLALDTIDGIFNAERDNRAFFFKLSPDIKRTLDKIRPDAVKYKNAYLDARKAYIASPTPAGLTALGDILAEVNRIMQAVSAAYPRNSAPAATPAK
jgi:hypothetical protein